MTGIKVMAVKLQTDIPEKTFNRSLKSIPSDWQEGVLKYDRASDRNLSLAGRLLLRNLMEQENILFNSPLKLSEKGKPYFSSDSDINFSISHSGQMAVCAITSSGSVGIDLEEHREIDFKFLKSAMSEGQWSEILRSHDPQQTFFNLWTKKESITKAIGLGLYIPFHALDVFQNPVKYEDQSWKTCEILSDRRYHCHLAFSANIIQEIDVTVIDQGKVFRPF